VNDEERIAYLAGEPGAEAGPAERAELEDLRALLAEPSVWAEPSPALEDRVVAAVTEASAVPPATPRATPPVPRGRRQAAALTGGLIAAAAIIVALVLVSAGGGKPPVQFRAALAGTALSPGASGEATLTKTTAGWRVRLHATGLPRLANGRFYEAWLKNPGGVLVPIGTFNQPTNITLWAGVPPTSFPTLTVTRQRANGDPASSGERVLVGVARPVR
jgi:Anti-sigma-K factor rskA